MGCDQKSETVGFRWVVPGYGQVFTSGFWIKQGLAFPESSRCALILFLCGVFKPMLRGLARPSQSSISSSMSPPPIGQPYAVFPDGSTAWEPDLATADPSIESSLAESAELDRRSPAYAIQPASTIHCVHSIAPSWTVAAIAIALCSGFSGLLAHRMAEAIAPPSQPCNPGKPARPEASEIRWTPQRVENPIAQE
ncbi:MAG: hypothetical protein D6742_18915 [Cyanobacteria bacterium J069]|nr:MAG: hypothetical protein D6742_18915 [Cyanobacteria bacterium J069]